MQCYLLIMYTTSIEVLLIFLLLKICVGADVQEVYKWSYINYTWPSRLAYEYYSQVQGYIPANNIPSTIKIHGGTLYMALGRLYPGTPVTLGSIKMKNNNASPLVTPYPSWEMNVQPDCTTLQNVNSFDIDKRGIMWILDGLRHNGLTSCPPKLVLFNITAHKTIGSYTFPSEGDHNGEFLAEIVVDGNFAFITDSNDIDPGIIVYSRKINNSWKLRDASMFSDKEGLKFSIGNSTYNHYHNVGPITISPPDTKKARFIFYSPVSSLNIYKLNINIIQNENTIENNSWRQYVHVAGTKIDQSYNYAMNNNGDLYFCLLNNNALAKWNIVKDFRTATYVAQNHTINWCTGSTFDNDYIYLMSCNTGNYVITNTKPTVRPNIFRLIKIAIKKPRRTKH